MTENEAIIIIKLIENEIQFHFNILPNRYKNDYIKSIESTICAIKACALRAECKDVYHSVTKDRLVKAYAKRLTKIYKPEDKNE